MITEPLEEAEATSKPVYDLPEASVGNEADDNSAVIHGESQSPDYLPDDGPPVESTSTISEEKDVDQASESTITATERDEDQISIKTDTFTEQDEDQASMQSASSKEQYVDQVSTKTATLVGPDKDQASVQIATSMGQDEDQESKTIATSMGQDGNQASMQMTTSPGQDVKTAISMDLSTSGDKDESPDAPSHNQENPEESPSLLSQNQGVLQMFVGFQNPVWDRLAENHRRSRTVSPSDSQSQEKIAGKLSVPEGQPETAPSADIPSAPPEDVQPSEGAADSSLDTSSPDQERMGITKSAEQEAEGFQASNPESKAPVPTGEDLADNSRTVQTPPPSPSSPGGSPPPSPDPHHISLDRNLLDPSLYRPDVENDYMRSMTSLLGGGEGSISSLADILVWSDTATGMGLALGLLASDHSSPADRLHDEGPSLRTVSSLLGSARSAFSSGLVAGTGSALRSVTHLLESVERRTVEGIRSAVRYLANHLTPRWARTGPN
ncbi:testis-expressed protein 44 [Mesocricetus auratus]|uniref:Testis-expressed protein 44 n=1 Tax=Mesocricetus auratus TaxID=10036 RepID=A0A1U8CDS7_MESAU|nr:testis-expressed protein 44 [Mesocricetus auratus]